MFRWTGPGRVPRSPAACAHARQASERQYPTMPGSRSGTPDSAYQRTAEPYSLIWSTVWLAPVPRSSGGRSAVSSSSGMADSSASITAGWKFAAAVPDVHTTATGRPLALASPRAVNDAERSSIRTCSRIRPARSSSSNAIASGADLEPGATTTSRSPQRASSSASTAANAVDGFTVRPSFRAQAPRRSSEPKRPSTSCRYRPTDHADTHGPRFLLLSESITLRQPTAPVIAKDFFLTKDPNRIGAKILRGKKSLRDHDIDGRSFLLLSAGKQPLGARGSPPPPRQRRRRGFLLLSGGRRLLSTGRHLRGVGEVLRSRQRSLTPWLGVRLPLGERHLVDGRAADREHAAGLGQRRGGHIAG